MIRAFDASAGNLTAAAELTEPDVAIVRFHLNDSARSGPSAHHCCATAGACNGTVTGVARMWVILLGFTFPCTMTGVVIAYAIGNAAL